MLVIRHDNYCLYSQISTVHSFFYNEVAFSSKDTLLHNFNQTLFLIIVEIEEGEEEPIPCCVDGKPVEKYVFCFNIYKVPFLYKLGGVRHAKLFIEKDTYANMLIVYVICVCVYCE